MKLSTYLDGLVRLHDKLSPHWVSQFVDNTCSSTDVLLRSPILFVNLRLEQTVERLRDCNGADIREFDLQFGHGSFKSGSVNALDLGKLSIAGAGTVDVTLARWNLGTSNKSSDGTLVVVAETLDHLLVTRDIIASSHWNGVGASLVVLIEPIVSFDPKLSVGSEGNCGSSRRTIVSSIKTHRTSSRERDTNEEGFFGNSKLAKKINNSKKITR